MLAAPAKARDKAYQGILRGQAVELMAAAPQEMDASAWYSNNVSSTSSNTYSAAALLR